MDCKLLKASKTTEPVMSAISMNMALGVFASRIRWTRVGNVMARGAHRSAPTSPANLSILSAIVSEITTVKTTNIVLCRFYSQVRQFPLRVPEQNHYSKISFVGWIKSG